MTRERGALGASLRMATTAAATTWVAMLSWRGFTAHPGGFVAALLVVGAVVAATGAIGRWRRLPGAVTVLAQLVLGGAVTSLYVAGTLYPGGEFWDAIRAAVDASNAYAAPVPEGGGITVQPLLIVGGFVAMLLVDVLACTLRRVSLAGLPLLTVYSVPVSLLDGGLSWWVFGATALGFLMLLFLQEQEHVGRWGRSLDPARTPSRRSEAVRGTAAVVGVAATAIAVAAPIVVPTFSLSVFDFGAGNGTGNDEIKIENPLLDLRRDLRRGQDVPLITITTTDPNPDHLRISVLNRFSNEEFSSGDRRVPSTNLANGTLPDLQGVSSTVRASARTYDYQVSINDDFESRWLPTQAPISAIDADGDWRFDETTMDFVAGDDDLRTPGMDYSMTAVQYDFLPEQVSGSNSTIGLSPDVTELPTDLSPLVAGYAREATEGTFTPYEQAVALQAWFRGGNGFSYSLDDAPEGKVGASELVDFLDPETGRVGYCEQYAAAMTVMARTLGIPARVAVGFLTPDRVPGSDDTWVYSAHDLHAWPELYLPGAGWVLFDPTPGARVPADAVPPYTTRGGETALPTATETSETTRPTRTSEPAVEPPPSSAAPEAQPDQTDADAGVSIPWLPILVGLGLIVLLVVLVLTPRTLRARQRARRLAGGPESAWEELRATVVDLGLRWPEARSPGEVEAVVGLHLGLPGDPAERPAHGPEVNPEAAAALTRIVRQVERARYARATPGERDARADPLADDVLTCVSALEAGVSPRTRRRASWLPRSVGQRRTVVEQTTPAEAVSSGVVEHI